MKKIITVAVADSSAEFRMKIRALICNQTDLEFVGETASALGAVNLIQALHIDVLLMSTEMPGLDVFVAVQRIHEKSPETRVISVVQENAHPAALRGFDVVSKCMDVGIRGYLPRDGPNDGILDGIRQVLLGYNYYCIPAVREALRRMCDKEVSPFKA
jgi:DNA-binding NarL/FixJ family response regulator